MNKDFILDDLRQKSDELHAEGLYKQEREIVSPQGPSIRMSDGCTVLNFCANNYLGLANHPELISAAKEGLDRYGFGLSSVRFICGTQTIHHQLEQSLSRYLQTEETILYSSCFDANGGLFETLLGPEDAIISDVLNHASIIDGIRLCKAKRLRYDHNDMADLERKLQETQNDRYRLIATDGVFSMDGTIANLKGICDLADRYQALVMVDDCHATGLLGAKGRGSHEYCGVMGRIDLLSGTLGKALGGASGGYISGKAPFIDWLRQRSRPYLFSNTLAPAIVTASLKALEIAEQGDVLRQQLAENSRYFRECMTTLGFQLLPGHHPIIPVMLKEAKLARDFAEGMLREGIYVVGFSYPVVPQGQARIRVQLSASHSKGEIDQALTAFERVGQSLGVING